MARELGPDPRVGTELAGYRIEALLGRGGMSVVYLAEDLALERKVALKLMAAELAEDRRFRERFRRESRLAASLDHPNVIPIYEAGEAEGILYIAMRYVDGTDLRSLLARGGPLAAGRALALLSQVADALDAAHARGLVHRDIKPSNVLLAAGEREHAYLADFGLTQTAAAGGQDVASVRLSGTPDYVAPEQITEGVSGATADLYSLGCVLYHCLAGHVPFPRESEFAVLWAHVDEIPQPPSELRPELPPALDAVVAKALAKDPGGRFETARELVEAARAAFPPERRRLGRRGLALAGGIAAVLIAGALAPALLLTRGEESANVEPTPSPALAALQRVDLATNDLVATIRIGGEPVDVAAGAGAIWVVDAARNSLVRVEPATGIATARGADAGSLAVAVVGPASSVGVLGDGRTGVAVERIDPRTLVSIEKTELRSVPGAQDDPAPPALSAVGDAVVTSFSGRDVGWVVDLAWGTVTRLGPGRFAGRATIETGGTPVDLAAAGSEIWVAQRTTAGRGGQEGSAVRLDGEGQVTATLPLSFAPSAIAAGSEGVWVTDREGERVWRLGAERGRATPVRLDGRPVDVAVGAGSAWVLIGGRGELVRVDAQTLDVLATVEVGLNPTALAVGEDGIWVAVGGGTSRSPGSLPRRYREAGLGLETHGLEPGRPGERCLEGLPLRDCLLLMSASFDGERGVLAGGNFAVRERRTQGRSVQCQGTTHDGPVTSDVRGRAGAGRLRVEGFGTVALTFEHNVEVYSTLTVEGGDPGFLCGEASGTWVGVNGTIKGETGTFTTFDKGLPLLTLTLE